MAKVLERLRIHRISLVDEPASQTEDGNFGAFVTLYKRKAEDDYMECKKCGASVSKDADKCPKCGAPMNNQAGDPPKERRMDELKANLAKAEADLKAAEELANEEQKKREAAEAEVATLKADLAKVKQTPEEIEKAKLAALPAEVRKQLDEQAAEIAKMRDEREDAEFVKRASVLKLTATTAEKFAPILKRLVKGKGTAEDAAELERVLKAQAEQARQGLKALTTEIGTGGFEGGAPDAGSALLRKADELRKSDAKLSEADAIVKAAAADPELYEEYRSGASSRA